MQGVEEEEGPHAQIQVITAPAELFEVAALFQQLRRRRVAAPCLEREIAGVGSIGGDDLTEVSGHRCALSAAPIRDGRQIGGRPGATAAGPWTPVTAYPCRKA